MTNSPLHDFFTRRILSPIVRLRDGERATALLMFGYSFLAMAGYNVIKPATRSKFIKDLGADNLPYVMLLAGLLMGLVMQGYSKALKCVPRRWVIPATQGILVGCLMAFWFLFRTRQDWVSAAFYFWGLLVGSLLISQFWTLANTIYDPRQAKRLFGFIGGGATLGGAAGAALAERLAIPMGTENLLLVSATLLTACAAVVWAVVRRQRPPERTGAISGSEEETIGGLEALQFLRGSTHLQLIALVIGFAAIGGAISEQQLNMAAGALVKGQDAITQFLARVTIYISLIGFLVQVGLTTRIHRLLGIGFALMVLPVSLGGTAVLMLSLPVLWTPALARIVDSSLRYTVDKTTREILFMPLATDLKYKVKPFVDVAVDRFAKGVGAALALLIAIKVFKLTWWQLSYLTLGVVSLWVFLALRARREYLASFRRSIEQGVIQPAELRLNAADLLTVETLVEQLASPDERRVLYAIDLLESLDKRNLVTPLLLRHESPRVRSRALLALASARPQIAERWAPDVQRMLKDESPEVRAAAVSALAAIRKEHAAELMRPLVRDSDARIAITAAVVLADSSGEEDVALAEATFTRLTGDARQSTAAVRNEVAGAIAQIQAPRFHRLLVPLMYDASLEVAQEAIRSAEKLGGADYLFVPPLVSLLRHRLLKPSARAVLVGYGEGVLDILGHFMRDPEEDIWVRRHIPATLALIPSQKSMDLLIGALADPDGFLRYKAVAAIERLRRAHPELVFDPKPIADLVIRDSRRYFVYLSLHYNLSRGDRAAKDSLLALALQQKLQRILDRVYRLLGLIYPWQDVASARWAIERGDARARSSAVEYLDNVLTGPVRRHLMPLLEDAPIDEKVRKGNTLLRTRVRDAEDSLAQLIHDEDQVVAAAAMHFVEEGKLWSLADDLEYHLAHRDVNDWYVFEAASWALAAHRFPEERRRALWQEPWPAVELADKLRRIPLFHATSVDELFRIAAHGRQVRYETGQVLYPGGMPPAALQVLLDGKVSLEARGAAAREVGAPCALAFEEVLEGTPAREGARALERTICLALGAEEFLTLLSDNIDLARGLFRTLFESPSMRGCRFVVKGEGGSLEARTTGGLKPIEKTLVLQQIPLFSRATASQLLRLATIAREVPLTKETELFRPSDRPPMYVIVTGQLAVEREPGGALVLAGPGDALGVCEALGGTTVAVRTEVARAGLALRIERDDLFELLGDHVDLVQGLYSTLLRAPAQ